MKITYTSKKENLSATDFNKLFKSAGWESKTFTIWKKIINGSGFIVRAYSNDKLVGFARVFDDGCRWGIICDVIVHKDFQRRGIATKMIKMTKQYAAKKKLQTLRLFANISEDPGLISFYKKLGFERLNNAMRLKGLVF